MSATSDVNIYGRTVFKGPKGGKYVLDTSGKKIYKFKMGTPAPMAAPSARSPPKDSRGRIIYRGPKGGFFVYANGSTKKIRIVATNNIKERARASYNTPSAPVLPPSSVNKVHKGAKYTRTNFRHGTNVVYKKNSSGRYYTWVLPGNMRVMKKSNRVTNIRTGRNNTIEAHVSGKPSKPAPVSTEGKMPTPSPLPVITTAERNRRLAEIRARLNAIKAKRLSDMPKARKNIEIKLRRAYWRARARRNTKRDSLAGLQTKQLKITFCHAPASVPRKKFTDRTVNLEVYTGSNPLIESGSVVAMQEKDFDLDWFKRQSTYISKLSDYDFWTVQAHTNRSHSWIGPYTYEGKIPKFDRLGVSTQHIKPLWPQIRKLILDGIYDDTEQWVKDFKRTTSESNRYRMFSQNLSQVPDGIKKMALETYKRDLKRIIAAAPKAKKKMILYRGSNFDIFRGTTGHWYKLKSFCSASYNAEYATHYGSSFQRITVLPGSPVLLVAGTNQWHTHGEYEVMVNIDTQYLIRGRGVTRHMYYDGRRQSKYRITDVTIMK